MIDRNLNTPGGGAWLLTNIAFVTKPPTVIDDYTLELVSDKPSPMVMQSFYMSSSAAVDPKIVAENATDEDPRADRVHGRQTRTTPAGPTGWSAGHLTRKRSSRLGTTSGAAVPPTTGSCGRSSLRRPSGCSCSRPGSSTLAVGLGNRGIQRFGRGRWCEGCAGALQEHGVRGA